MNKKFETNPALEHVSEENKRKRAPRKKKTMQEVPFGYVVAPEPKTERVHLLLKKSVKDLLKDDSEKRGVSVNIIACEILEEYYARREGR